MSKQKRKNRNIFKQFKSTVQGVKNKALTPFKGSQNIENIGGKVESDIKNKVTSRFKDLFTFQGSEQITQITNTVSNVKSAIENPTEYVETYVKHKILNKILTGVTDLLSAGVSAISKSGGEIVKQVGKKITKKLTEVTKEKVEESEEGEDLIEWYGPLNPPDDGSEEGIEWYGPWDPPDDGDDDEDDGEGEGVGHMTMREFLNKKLNELPTQLLIREKSGSYRVVSIEGYKNMLINIFKDKISRNKDAYEGSSASEFLQAYDEFNRDYDSAEGEETIQINYENLFDWLAF